MGQGLGTPITQNASPDQEWAQSYGIPMEHYTNFPKESEIALDPTPQNLPSYPVEPSHFDHGYDQVPQEHPVYQADHDPYDLTLPPSFDTLFEEVRHELTWHEGPGWDVAGTQYDFIAPPAMPQNDFIVNNLNPSEYFLPSHDPMPQFDFSMQDELPFGATYSAPTGSEHIDPSIAYQTQHFFQDAADTYTPSHAADSSAQPDVTTFKSAEQ